MANPAISASALDLAPQELTASGVENPYTARYAGPADAVAIDHVVREAFGASAPKSSAARDMKRNKTTYIVVTRKNGNGDSAAGGSLNGGNGWGGKLRSLLTASIGSFEPHKTTNGVVGLVGIWTGADQTHIVVIASRPEERRRGIGELLMIATIAEGIKIGATNATLEVRRSNSAARALYRKYGFTDVGIRHRYYADNREDAVIMSTPAFSNLNFRRSLLSRCEAYFGVRGKTELQFDPVPYLSLPE